MKIHALIVLHIVCTIGCNSLKKLLAIYVFLLLSIARSVAAHRSFIMRILINLPATPAVAADKQIKSSTGGDTQKIQ